MRSLLAVVLVVAPSSAFSQSVPAPAPSARDHLPFLTKAESDFLAGETSGDRSYEHVRWYTHWHRPFASEGLMAAAKYTEERAREMGLANVALVKTPHSGIEWTPKRAELWLVEPETSRLCDIGSVQLSLLDRSRSADVTAAIVDAGAGDTDASYAGKDVAGTIVLAWGAPAAVMKEAVWKRGAAGIVVRPDPDKGFARPEQVRWLSIPEKSEDGKPGTFAFGLSHRQGVELAAKCKAGAVRARALVESVVAPGWLVMVSAEIPGTEPNLPAVVFTGHLQEERFSANDDASGCANTLEVARAIAKGIAEGKLPRPRRTLRFWWTTEIQSEDQLFAEHPEIASTILCDVNQDMVGANQGQETLRVQNVTRLPWSRAHLLEDVAEEVVRFLVEGNSSQLAGLQAGQPYYPFPVIARLGTRHRFNARLVPYHANTDHQCFVAPPIGIPGITFTNWPDDFIHSTDDDLRNLDPTQLQRNALAAATIGYAMARFDADDAETLALLVRSHASRRLGEEAEVAARLLREAAPGDRPAALRGALAHARASVARERWALASVADVAGAAAEPALARLRPTLDAHEKGVTAMLAAVAGVDPAAPTDAQRELAAMHPRRVGSVKDYQERRPKLKPPAGLHGLLVHEVLCLCDASARRGLALDGLALYELVAAQARSAGAWYYGTVSPAQVLELLRAAADARLITLDAAGRDAAR